MSEDRLTPAEVAELYGLSEYTVRAYARNKTWPHLRIGSKTLFTREHVAQIDELHNVPVAPAKAAEKSWGRKTRSAS